MGCWCSAEKGLSVKMEDNSDSNDDEDHSAVVRAKSAKYKFLKYSDYANDMKFLSAGATGRVYSCLHEPDEKRFALKFFGYTQREPDIGDIFAELEKLQALSGVDGTVQYEGIIMDSSEGYIPDKVYQKPYPIIVMEFLEGGELFNKIHHRSSVSEYDIARMFRDVVQAVGNIHNCGYIHRDLKLENLMLVNSCDNSPLKLIDFDTMVQLPDTDDGIYRGYAINGTAGYVAPESILYFNYSAASDLWQLGCILYTMLSGLPAFNPEDNSQTIRGAYFPMEGIGWDGISEAAKSLVRGLLNKNPKYRISIAKILEQPWMSGDAPRVTLGEAYLSRVRNLALRQQLRSFFMDSTVRSRYTHRRDKLRDVIPLLLATPSMVIPDVEPEETPAFRSCSRLHSIVEGLDTSTNTNDSDVLEVPRGLSLDDVSMADSICTAFSKSESLSSERNSPRTQSSRESLPQHNLLKHYRSMKVMLLSTAKKRPNLSNVSLSSSRALSKSQSSMSSNGINREGILSYEEFAPVYEHFELPLSSFDKVCALFDPECSGFVDMKDFLITMISLRREAVTGFTPENIFHGTSPDAEQKEDQIKSHSSVKLSPSRGSRGSSRVSNEEIIKLYFDIFDVDEDGYIQLEDLKLVAKNLLLGSGDTEDDFSTVIDDLFGVMDTDHNRMVDYSEFKTFYKSLLEHPMLRRM